MLALGCAAFLLFGVVLVLLGACEPGLVASLGLDDAGWGLLGGSLSLGIGAGVLVAGPLVDRFPRRPLFLASTLLTGCALATVGDAMSPTRAMLHIMAMGAGAGIYDTLLNAVAIERWRERSVRPLGLLHAMVAVGAIATPTLVALGGGTRDWVEVFRATGLAYFALSAWVALVPFPAPSAQATAPSSRIRSLELIRRPAFMALCLIGFAYIGIEAALMLFAIPYAEGALGLSELRGGRAISAFWMGILFGRVALVIGVERIRGFESQLLAATGAAAALIIGFGTGLGFGHVELLLGATGLAVSATFPLMIALAGREMPEAPGLATGLVAGLGSAGGFALPWLTGNLADVAGVGLAMTAIAAWCALISAAALVSQRTSRARTGGEPCA